MKSIQITHGDMGGGRASYGRDHKVMASASEGHSKVKSAQQWKKLVFVGLATLMFISNVGDDETRPDTVSIP